MTLEFSELYAPLRFREKARVSAAALLSAAVFMTVGWRVLAPFDPEGAISLLELTEPMRTALVVFVLAWVLSTVGRLIAGPKLPDVGLFVAAFGLGVVSLRAGTMESLLLMAQGMEPEARGALCAKLLVELWVWMAIVFTAYLLSGYMLNRLGFRNQFRDSREAVKRSSGLIEVLGLLLGGHVPRERFRAELRAGLSSVAVGTAAAAVVISMAISYSSVSAIVKGQVYFAIGAAFFVGALAGHQMFHPRWSMWSLLPVPLLCSLGYAWGWLRPDVQNAVPMILRSAREKYNMLAAIPPNDFARATPLEYIGIGLAAAVAGFWFSRHTHRLREEAEE